jgi:hypothetical protein
LGPLRYWFFIRVQHNKRSAGKFKKILDSSERSQLSPIRRIFPLSAAEFTVRYAIISD